VTGYWEHGDETSRSRKGEQILDQMSNNQLIEEDFVPYS
jgi:hypothetical protein